MAEFKALDPKAEVIGSSFQNIIDAMPKFTALAIKILKEHGIEKIHSEQWYPIQLNLDLMKEIADKVGPTTLQKIGLAVPTNNLFPPEINSIETALSAMDKILEINHRYGNVGHYYYTKPAANMAKMVSVTAYPCDFEQGLFLGFARKFAAKGAFVKIAHDPLQPCRKKGGDSCTNLLSW